MLCARGYALLLCVSALTAAPGAGADEGMWPYNMFPADTVKAKYGVAVDQALLDKMRLGSVRFNNGGSASFVSPDGLVMTNQHVGRDCIQKLSMGEENLLRDGFLAAARGQERRCPDLELNQTVAITDVTSRVKAARDGVGPQATDAQKNDAIKAEMAAIEKTCAQQKNQAGGDRFRCDVVTLYSGGAYHLYTYRKYTDVRLVWAPENAAKHFGGERDNFSFPRMSLDVTFFRVYEKEKPLDSRAFYLPFDKKGAREGDVVFVSGHPGSTGRLTTPAELELLRDVIYPFYLEGFTTSQSRFADFIARGPRQRQVALADWLRASNAKKAIAGYLQALRDPSLMGQARQKHETLQQQVKAMPEPDQTRLGQAWPKIAEATRAIRPQYTAYAVTEGRFSPQGQLALVARHLVRLPVEDKKPDGDRLREYRDSNRKSLELELFSAAPLDPDLEALKIQMGLEAMVQQLGPTDPTVRAALAGQTPAARAQALVKGTKLFDVEARRALYQGGAAAVNASRDPLITFVKSYDGTARKLRAAFEDEYEAALRVYAGRVAEAWSAVHGQSTYPDATFTLRLAVGVVKGYDEGNTHIDWRTQVGDIYRRHKRAQGKPPYELPPSFVEAMPRVDFSVPYNFVSTNDIIGGNSGSPVINPAGRVVGLIFDGNIHQLGNRFVYRSDQERAVSVHVAGILHMLERVYRADHLVTELLSDDTPG